MDNSIIIGIDLGTTNSEVAFVRDLHPEILQNGDGEILPSCVGLDEEGRILVGAGARNQAVAFPERTVLSVKREMGKDKKISLDGQSYSPQEISAFILKALKEKAEKALGRSVGHAVITVPAYFTDAQRQATQEAGAIAGLEVIRIINEPTAAALAYEGARGGQGRRTILVYDLGGGTFDVSIVRMEEGVVEVLASTGDNHLGGDDFDDLIAAWLAGLLKENHGLDVAENRAVSARLKACAEKAKIELSRAPFTRIEEDHITDEIHLSVELTRESFEEMIRDEIEKTMKSVTQALGDADLGPGEIDRILLVGGSTRIPMVSEMLREKMGIEPSQEIDPDLCVALGAGIQAAREMGVDSSGVLIDITPYTFGTSAAEVNHQGLNPHLFVPLIKRNTKLPASRTEAFYTMYDQQEKALLQVYQGESKNALDNILIRSYYFDLSGTPAGSMLTLKYELDINGILKLEAVEKDTGRRLDAVIDNVFSCDDPDGIKASQEKIGGFFQEEESLKPSVSRETDSMPEDIRDMLSQAGEKLDLAPEEDREEIINLVEDITTAAKAGDFEKARAICEELDDILFYID